MKKLVPIAVSLLVVASLGATLGASPGATASSHRKAQSDAKIRAAESQLQAGSMALQNGNEAQTIVDLTSAVQDLKKAQPIYHGYRDKAIAVTNQALKVLKKSGPNASTQAAKLIDKAISDAEEARLHLSS